MQKIVFTVLAALCWFGSVKAAPLAEFSGQITDKTAGWKFQPSKPNKQGMTFNEFEGYYPDKGGKLFSRRIKLDKPAGEASYYRITFSARANERSYQGINFYNAAGAMLPDNYDVLYAGERRDYDRVFYAMGKVDSVEIFFQSNKGCQVWDVKLEKATYEDAVKYCDRVAASEPAFSFTAPADSFKDLPRTAAALRSGTPWRIVMLGDSIMQDTFHSQFHALVKREFPRSDISWIISMRGATGCWHYCMADNFYRYVVAEKPDLLIIGGISNHNKPTGKENMETVIRAARQLGCEVLVMSDPLAVDTRNYDPENPDKPLPAQPWLPKSETNPGNLAKTRSSAKSQRVPFWDMTTAPHKWLYASGEPWGFYSRDYVHSGEKGKQIIGRTVLEYFKTAANVAEK